MPAISVVLPCYNAAETLDEALASLTAQTFADFEIVAVDDGSTDATPAILARWAEAEPRLRLIALRHQGIVGALRAGMEVAQAPLVARMDADDRSHPERLERQLAFLECHPDIAVVSCLVAGFPAEHVREGFRVYIDWLNSLVSDEEIRREMFVESPLAHPSVLARRAWIERVGGYQDRGWPEDYDLWLRLYLAGAHFAKVPQVLLDWREHPVRLTRSDSRYSLENFLRAKACYLVRGPLQDRDAVLVWGAGMIGRRISKHLLRYGAALVAFVDVDPKKIGGTRRNLPILAPNELPIWWRRYTRPALLAAVGSRGARRLIREQLRELGLIEGYDWWAVA